MPALTQEAASLTVATWPTDVGVEVEVAVSNSVAGHLLPSGTTTSVVVLNVEAFAADGSPIKASSGPRLPPGVNAPSGRSGWLYALTPTGDTRLEPFATHRSRYLFATATPDEMTIVTRLDLCRFASENDPQCSTLASARAADRW